MYRHPDTTVGYAFLASFKYKTMRKIKWFIKNLIRIIKSYKFSGKRVKTAPCVIFIFDPEIKHPGLMDRMKGIVGAYLIAKSNNRSFKILFEPYSDLPNYVEPNVVDWIIKPEDISYSLKNSRIINYYGYGKLPKLNNKVNQYHIYNYLGLDVLLSNDVLDWQEKWTSCYNSLFRPTKLLLQHLNELPYQPNSYVAVHIRCVNALELQEPDYSQRPLQKDDGKKLINDCLRAISVLQKRTKLPVLVFSDSNTLLVECEKSGYHVLKGDVGHISYSPTDDVVKKTFVDLYMISRAKAVYQIYGEHLYKSAFSYYGALIGGKRCVRINLSDIHGSQS